MATPSDAKQLVQSTADQVLARVRTERETLRVDRARLYGLVNELIIPHFDFRRISRWVLGKHWRGATPEQKQRFTEEFQKLLTRTYATVLLEYVDQEIRYLPVKAAPSADKVTVRSEITRPGAGVPIPVNYHMHSKDDAWKVYDISVDGVSLLSTYRSSFGPEVRKYGLDGLISRLEAKEVTNMPATPQ
jgi:phospholipid transport system substrate-binding protein